MRVGLFQLRFTCIVFRVCFRGFWPERFRFGFKLFLKHNDKRVIDPVQTQWSKRWWVAAQSQLSPIQISDVNISGYVLASNVSGSLIAFVSDVIQILVSNSKICSNINKYAGLNSVNLQLVGSLIISSEICRSKTYAYVHIHMSVFRLLGKRGAYRQQIRLQELLEFNGEQCHCPDGQVLNGSLCISVLNLVNEVIQRQLMLNQSIQSLNVNGLETKVKELEYQQQQISVEIEEFKDVHKEIQNSIISNSSSIQNYIVLNTTNILQNLERNTTILDKDITMLLYQTYIEQRLYLTLQIVLTLKFKLQIVEILQQFKMLSYFGLVFQTNSSYLTYACQFFYIFINIIICLTYKIQIRLDAITNQNFIPVIYQEFLQVILIFVRILLSKAVVSQYFGTSFNILLYEKQLTSFVLQKQAVTVFIFIFHFISTNRLQ
ncbi:Hypothetical_protein [Hexamita inflata]|uniref:Hypothetical_protein n=1 Tax=Hexamita inflata TaxID=28002 RepID=A0AA86UYS7_9EUKA|nr:Hypothetical protein HINF_LOCUS57391 [Hexamita inflata]